MKILVTGGAGYIGTHTLVELQEAGHQLVVVDNLCNSCVEALYRVEQISGQTLEFVEGDVRDRALLDRLLTVQSPQAVIHFAGLKAVGESVENPLVYYENNVGGTLSLCQAMAAAGVFRLVFSSSATVYGDPKQVPIREDFETGAVTNPYGRSKWMVEEILRDLVLSDPRWSVGLLRYFNPIGAHVSGLIGENPRGVPCNLLPYITQVAVGRLAQLSVFGGDYPTVDGTGVRDYIHVSDLASGHVKALHFLAQQRGLHIWNLGTGCGYSVLQMVAAFEAASGCKISYNIGARRAGDIAECWSDSQKAQLELGWKAERDLMTMMTDAWRWQKNNPGGYSPLFSCTDAHGCAT